MRKYIISDLHGNGEVYDSIMGYLENVALIDDVELYINGDLIDRGLNNYYMLDDVIKRCFGEGNIKIIYLAGNHELMFYQACLERKPGGAFNHFSNWIESGGWLLEGELDMCEEEKTYEFMNFVKDLKIYHKFEETINGNNLLLVHAQAPEEVLDNCNITIGDNNKIVEDALWNRKEIRIPLIFGIGDVIGYNKLGKEGYYTIIGHTPVKDEKGFTYDIEDKVFNIDGGCAGYALGYFEKYNHVPLVEIKNNKLEFLIFNHNNQIIDGYIFDGEMQKLNDRELDKRRIFINHSYDDRENEVRNEIIQSIVLD